MAEYAERRRRTQPIDLPSLGSVFKRPLSGYAARYIDEAGLRGSSIGGASVSEKHTGFIVNHGNATAQDVIELIEKIKAEVFSRFSVELEPEIRIVR
jgi:UDP-N-acetylmuramate dehydrogenase